MQRGDGDPPSAQPPRCPQTSRGVQSRCHSNQSEVGICAPTSILRSCRCHTAHGDDGVECLRSATRTHSITLVKFLKDPDGAFATVKVSAFSLSRKPKKKRCCRFHYCPSLLPVFFVDTLRFLCLMEMHPIKTDTDGPTHCKRGDESVLKGAINFRTRRGGAGNGCNDSARPTSCPILSTAHS